MSRRLRAWLGRLCGIFAGSRAERDLDNELRSHLQLHIDDNTRAGMTPEEAWRHAVIALGGVARTKDAYRDRRGVPMIESMLRDVRYGVRVLAKSPWFSIAVVLILGLGIGANTAMFSVVNAVALRPLAFPEPDRLVRVWHVPPPRQFPGMTRFTVSPANYLDWRAQNDVFERMAIYGTQRVNLTTSSLRG